MSDNRVRVGAYGLVLRGRSLLLCRLRTLFPGSWTLPGGGMEFGEHPSETVVRELLEETGYDVAVDGKPDIFSYVSPETGLQGLSLLYPVQIVGGELRSEINGTTDLCGWVDLNEAKDLPLVPLAKRGIEVVTSTLMVD